MLEGLERRGYRGYTGEARGAREERLGGLERRG